MRGSLAGAVIVLCAGVAVFGNPSAALERGRRAYDRGRYDEVCEAGLEAARAGDYHAAVLLLTRAADRLYAPAAFELANLYEWGPAPLRSDADAARYYRVSAGSGDPEALFRLARMYEEGRGVRQDDAEALRLYRLAASKSHAGARFRIQVMIGGAAGGTGARQRPPYTLLPLPAPAGDLDPYREARDMGLRLLSRDGGATDILVDPRDGVEYRYQPVTVQREKGASVARRLVPLP